MTKDKCDAITDEIHTLIEQEKVKLEMLELKKFSKYKIAKQKAYINGMIDTWNFIKTKIKKDL